MSPASTQSPSDQQRSNPVQTPLVDPREIADFVLQAIETWKENHLLRVCVLKVVAELCKAHPERAEKGFTNVEIVETLPKICPDNRPPEPEDARDWVRDYWNELEELWVKKEEGLEQLAEENGQTWVPVLFRIRGFPKSCG